MMYKDGEFKEGISRSDLDMTKKAEVWEGLQALTREEARQLKKDQNIGTTIIDINAVSRIEFK